MTSRLNATDDRELHLTNPEEFGMTSSTHESADNKCPEGWVPLFQNPWIEPGMLVLTGDGEKSNAPADRFVARSRAAPMWPKGNEEMDDEEWVKRSSAALRDWLDENSF